MDIGVFIPLGGMLTAVIIVYIVNNSRQKELEMRQGMGPDMDDLNEKMDKILAKLEDLEKRKP
ncbi:hypothetical protein [Shouchella shacheensis]|uniref:hypothetical protein n=1 Tax=Shouchella shacheensis TaxID=1649580 RepID=UPI000740228E|nr:hypothetical protein [Shouchella shacheensis]